MSVDVLNETDYRLDEIELVALARYVMEQMRVHPGADLCIRLVDEDAMEVLHVQWMDLPGPTDVMSFPMDELRPGREGMEPEEEREMFELQRQLLLTFLAGRGRPES